jgi:hypothetical protein
MTKLFCGNLQRWPNRDPFGEKGGINLYSFVANDPLAYWDLFGLDSCRDKCNQDYERAVKWATIGYEAGLGISVLGGVLLSAPVGVVGVAASSTAYAVTLAKASDDRNVCLARCPAQSCGAGSSW